MRNLVGSEAGCNTPSGFESRRYRWSKEHALVVPAEWTPGFQSGERGFESRRGCWKRNSNKEIRNSCIWSLQNSQMVEWETRGPQKAVPLWREGSSPSLATESAKWRNRQTHPAQTRTSQDVRVRIPPWPLLFRGRLTGRTTGSEPANVGSIPAPGTVRFACGFTPSRKHLSLECGGGTPPCEGGSCRFDSCRGYCGRTQSGSGTRL